MRPDRLELARQQSGLLTARQFGIPDPDWVEVQPAVFAPAVLTLTREQQLTAVSLALDERSSTESRALGGLPWCFAGSTAARLWGLDVPEKPPVVLVRGSSRPALRGVVVRTARAMPLLGRAGGHPVPTIAVAILQCARELSRDELLSLVEYAVRKRRCRLPELLALCRRGVVGSGALRSVVEELQKEGQDRWVRVLVRLLVAAGLPRPELERGVPSDRPRIYIDLCWWHLCLAVEVDDWETHGSRDASERDVARDRWLWKTYGVLVLRVTPRQVRDKPDVVVGDIVAAYRRAERAAAESLSEA